MKRQRKSSTSWKKSQSSLYVSAIRKSETINDIMQDTDLDRAQLSLCVSLIENGVNPEALAVSQQRSLKKLTC